MWLCKQCDHVNNVVKPMLNPNYIRLWENWHARRPETGNSLLRGLTGKFGCVPGSVVSSPGPNRVVMGRGGGMRLLEAKLRVKYSFGAIIRCLIYVSISTRPAVCNLLPPNWWAEAKLLLSNLFQRYRWPRLLSNSRVTIPHILYYSLVQSTYCFFIKLTLPQFLQWCLLLLQENFWWQEKQLGQVPSGTQLGRSMSKRSRWFGYYVLFIMFLLRNINPARLG